MNLGLFTLEDMQSVTAVVRVANFLIVRRQNGTIEDYAIDPIRNSIYHPFLNPNQSASGNAVGYRAARGERRRLVLTLN